MCRREFLIKNELYFDYYCVLLVNGIIIVNCITIVLLENMVTRLDITFKRLDYKFQKN
jgi:hypothetical protein